MRGSFEPRWYLCEVLEREEAEEPDWSRVPASKRDEVRQRWQEKHAIRPEGKDDDLYWLWGPQIALYDAHPGYTVRIHDAKVLRPASGAINAR